MRPNNLHFNLMNVMTESIQLFFSLDLPISTYKKIAVYFLSFKKIKLFVEYILINCLMLLNAQT